MTRLLQYVGTCLPAYLPTCLGRDFAEEAGAKPDSDPVRCTPPNTTITCISLPHAWMQTTNVSRIPPHHNSQLLPCLRYLDRYDYAVPAQIAYLPEAARCLEVCLLALFTVLHCALLRCCMDVLRCPAR